MQLTTPQIYALAAMAVLVVILIGISYVSGLRTGRKAGKEAGFDLGRRTATTYWKEMIGGIRENNAAREQNLLRKLDDEQGRHDLAIAEATQLQKDLDRSEKATERLDNLIGRLQAKALTPEDVLNIKLAARQLANAAKHIERSGTNKPNQAHLASVFLTEIADRFLEASPNPSPQQTIERDENGVALPPCIDYIGDGKSTWERIDDEHRALGLPAPQCM